jgi:hypothetical protein
VAQQWPQIIRDWLSEHRRAVVTVLIVVAILVLVPLLAFPFLGGLGGGVVSEIQ